MLLCVQWAGLWRSQMFEKRMHQETTAEAQIYSNGASIHLISI